MGKRKRRGGGPTDIIGSDQIDVAVGGAETVTLGEGSDAIDIVVYPLGLRHLRKFNAKFQALIPILADIDFENIKDDKTLIKAVIATITPRLLDDLFELIEDCVVFKREGVEMDHLPHWHLAPIAETWIRISFGEEKKWRPWIRAIDSTIARFTRRSFSILETFSRSLSPQDTTEKTSSIDDSPDAPTTDGVSASSSSGADEANGSTQEESPQESTSSPQASA